MKKISEDAARTAAAEWLAADIKLGKVQAEKREKVTPIVAKYEAQERELTDQKKEMEALLERYATENRDALLPGDKKSTGFEGTTIGFKKSPSSLKVLTGYELEEIITALEDDEILAQYVICKKEMDKAGILRNVADIGTGLLEDIGLTVEQKETFFVKA